MTEIFIEGVERSIKCAMQTKGKTDWLGMESAIRDVFKANVENEINNFQALNYISEIVGAFTGRGFPAIGGE